MKTKTKVKRVKAWAVLGFPDRKPMVFGNMGRRGGSYSVFESKAQAKKMTKNIGSWLVVPCEIVYSIPHAK